LQKFFLTTLGCSKNEVDSGLIKGILQKANYKLTSSLEEAEFIIINTCGFIEPAQKESIEAILEAAKLKNNTEKKLVVTGCLVQRFAKELEQEIPEIDLLVGIGKLNQLPYLLETIKKGEKIRAVGESLANELDYRLSHPQKEITAYVKIAEGCNRRCSFCTIPTIKGNYRSRPLSEIKEEVELLVASGTKEVILIAQDLTYYGRDLESKADLLLLLESLASISELKWLRLLYLYPEPVLEGILELMQSDSPLLPYLDLPLQHVSPRILRSMNRPGSYEIFLELIEKMRKKIPGLVLRSSFILGYPSETEKDFELLIKFLRTAQLDRADFFMFSAEEKTRAYYLENQISPKVKEERYRKAFEVQEKISYRKNLKRVGEEVEVLMEGYEGLSWGRWAGQAPEIDGVTYLDQDIAAGEFVSARLVDAQGFDLMAEKIGG